MAHTVFSLKNVGFSNLILHCPMMMTTRTIADQIRICSSCDREQSKEHYSKNQWKKGEGAAKCKVCIEETSLPAPPSHCSRVCAPTTSPLPTHHNSPKPASTNVITTISLQERPQIPIPGFDDGLSCCADWPKTKSGHPPGAQSAVYNPLLACVFGVALRDHCTLEQLTVAHAWWTRALPAWPRWVEELRRVGVNGPVYRNKLLASAKGRPNPLIHKAKGRGTVPHIAGKKQKEALEKAPMVSLEVDACIQTMYLRTEDDTVN